LCSADLLVSGLLQAVGQGQQQGALSLSIDAPLADPVRNILELGKDEIHVIAGNSQVHNGGENRKAQRRVGRESVEDVGEAISSLNVKAQNTTSVHLGQTKFINESNDP
jgi:hypothetical protein